MRKEVDNHLSSTASNKENKSIDICFTYQGSDDEISCIKELISSMGKEHFDRLLSADLYQIINNLEENQSDS